VLLLAVASVLAVLVGLVGTGERPISHPRTVASEPWSGRRASIELSAPTFAAPPEVEPAAATAALRPEPSAASRSARGRLTGLVLRPEGEPASGARIVLGKQQASCDREGRFELVLSSDPSGADLVAFESGHEPVLRAAFASSLAAGGENTVRLVLGPPTLTLSGQVAGRDARPLKGWTVELDGLDPLAACGLREPVQTDAQGRFVLSDVPAGVHVLRAWKERREHAFGSAPAAAGETGIVIVVDATE
jgi:hypothetical protein